MLEALLHRYLYSLYPDEGRREDVIEGLTNRLALVLVIAMIVVGIAVRPAPKPDTQALQKVADTQIAAVKAAYDAMSKAAAEGDADGLLHYYHRRGSPSDATDMPLSSSIIADAENGYQIPSSFFLHDDPNPTFQYKPIDRTAPSPLASDVMLVSWRSGDARSYQSHTDTWERVFGEWELYWSKVTETIDKASAAVEIDRAYGDLQRAIPGHAFGGPSSVLSANFQYVTQTGVVLTGSEASYVLLRYVGNAYRQRSATSFGAKDFRPDRSCVIERRVAVGTTSRAHYVVVYSDTWAPEGKPWKLIRTAVVEAKRESVQTAPAPPSPTPPTSSAVSVERLARDQIADAYVSFDRALNIGDIEGVMACVTDDFLLVATDGSSMTASALRQGLASSLVAGQQQRDTMQVFTLGQPMQAVTIATIDVTGRGRTGATYACDLWIQRAGRWLLQRRQNGEYATTSVTVPKPWTTSVLRQEQIDGKSAADIQGMIDDLYAAAGAQERFNQVQSANNQVLTARRAYLQGR